MAKSPFEFNEPLERRVVEGLIKIGLVLKNRSWQGAELQGVTPTQSQILAILYAQPQMTRLSEIAKRLAVSAPTASESVTTLVEKGLIEKKQSLNDRRAVILSLTHAGHERAAKASRWSDFLLNAVDSLSQEEQKFLFKALIKVIQSLQEQGMISASRMCVTCQYFRPNRYDNTLQPHHCAFVNAPFSDQDLRLDCPEHQTTGLDLES